MKKFSGNSQEYLLRRIRDIPSLPEVVDRIILLMGKPSTHASEIAQLISYDPGLTSKVLRMVNSAAYGFQRQISSVQHAIMILGFNTVRGLVLSASIFKLLESRSSEAGLDQRSIWEHCLLTATIARILAQFFHLPEVEDAFSAGMLHDVGKIILDVYFHEDYVKVLETARRRNIPPHGEAFLDLEYDLLGTTHPEIGGFLANKWKLPIAIAQVIENHHCPQDAKLCQPLVYLVSLANQLSPYMLQQSEEDSERGPLLLSPSLVEYFKLDEAKLTHIIALIEAEIASTEDLLDAFSSH